MKLSQVIAGVTIGFAVVGSASASDGLKLATMSDKEYSVVSMFARCSVAYSKIAGRLPASNEVGQELVIQSAMLEQALKMLMADRFEAEGLIKWNSNRYNTDRELAKAAAECAEILSTPIAK